MTLKDQEPRPLNKLWDDYIVAWHSRDENRKREVRRTIEAEAVLEARLQRIIASHELTREEEAQWDMGPIGPRDEIGCVVDAEYLVYVDGQGNPLEPGWVLAVLRGDKRAEMSSREARQHPWMPKREVVVAVLPRKRPHD